MKTMRHLFVVVGFGILAHGLSFAGEPPGQAAEQQSPKDQATSNHAATLAPDSQLPRKTNKNDGKYSAPKDDSQTSETSNQAALIEKTPTAFGHVQGRPEQVANGHEASGEKPGGNIQTGRTSANNFSQSGLSKVSSATKDGLVMKKIENHPGQPARLPIGSGTAAPLSGVVRSRGAAAPIIGGATTASAKTAVAVINGTAMKRKF